MSAAPFRPRSVKAMIWRADENEVDLPGEMLEVGSAVSQVNGKPVLSLELTSDGDGFAPVAPLFTMHLDREKAQQLFAYIGAWLHHPSSAQ